MNQNTSEYLAPVIGLRSGLAKLAPSDGIRYYLSAIAASIDLSNSIKMKKFAERIVSGLLRLLSASVSSSRYRGA